MHSELNYETMTGNLNFFQKAINVKNKNVMFNWQIEFKKKCELLTEEVTQLIIV